MTGVAHRGSLVYTKNKGTGVVKSQLSLNVYQGAMLAINPKGLFDTL